jgi:hypothetical protein
VEAGNGMKNDEQIGTRHLIKKDGHKYYAWISDTDIMFFPPNDAGVQDQEQNSAINAICRLISKLREMGGSWDIVLKQLDGANVTGNQTWCKTISGVIRDNQTK